MMTREEFDAFWLPKVNEVACARGMAPVTRGEMDGLWHNYLLQQDGDLQDRAEAIENRMTRKQ